MEKCEVLVERWFDRVWMSGDADYIDKALASNCCVTGLTPEPITSPAQFREFHQSLSSLFKDFDIKLDHILEEDCIFSGVVSSEVTHIPTNKRVKFKSSFFGSIKDGQMVEVTNLFDYLTILEQIGAIPDDFVGRAMAGEAKL